MKESEVKQGEVHELAILIMASFYFNYQLSATIINFVFPFSLKFCNPLNNSGAN